MRKFSWCLLATLFVASLFSCKNTFESIRKSNDYETKLVKANEYYEKEEWYKAQVLLEQLLAVYRGTNKVEEVYFKFAKTHFELRNYILASYYFKNFHNTFQTSQFAEEALYLSAFANFEQAPLYRLDQGNTQKAIDGFQYFANFYPKSQKVAECNKYIDILRERLEEKAFEEANLYFKLTEYEAAITSFQNMLRDYPDSPWCEEGRFLMLNSHFKLAQNSIDLKKVERFEETITEYNTFKRKYPNSKYIGQANSILASSKNLIKRYTQ